MSVAIAKVYRVPRVKGIVTFDGVLVFAVIGDCVGRKIVKSDAISSRATCYRPSEREGVAERTEAVNLKVFKTEGVRNSKLACGEPRYAKVADAVWAFDVLPNGIRSQIQSIW